ncbi:hypothetical protein QYF61_008239 [Mycteria americana]|uniref:Uncharacterized protein n=1 Tax=Mycteria americana TaxID=33587 RepID=A0AAN7N9X9_MYCAM|nr:hypothetical protein QYF61_008239 [Mycteria americana]
MANQRCPLEARTENNRRIGAVTKPPGNGWTWIFSHPKKSLSEEGKTTLQHISGYCVCANERDRSTEGSAATRKPHKEDSGTESPGRLPQQSCWHSCRRQKCDRMQKEATESGLHSQQAGYPSAYRQLSFVAQRMAQQELLSEKRRLLPACLHPDASTHTAECSKYWENPEESVVADSCVTGAERTRQPGVTLPTEPSEQACFGCSILPKTGRTKVAWVSGRARVGCSCDDALFAGLLLGAPGETAVPVTHNQGLVRAGFERLQGANPEPHLVFHSQEVNKLWAMYPFGCLWLQIYAIIQMQTWKSLPEIIRDGDSTTSLGSLFQCLTTLSVKKFFLMSNLNLPWRNWRPFPLILSLVTWEKRPTPPLDSLLSESDEVSPQPPFLQAEQAQGPQPLPISLVLQTLPQLRCPSLDTLQPLNVSLEVRGPALNTAFEVRPHQCPVQGHSHCPAPAGHTTSDTSQDATGLLGHLGPLLAHIQAAVNQHPQVLLCRAAFQPLFPNL